jgi:3-dehydroquinate dehydratase-2
LKLLIINGPNLNLLGRREPEIYGTRTFEEYLAELRGRFPQHEIGYFQSNVEGEIIDALQGAGCPVVLNAGGYTHTSVAIRDAVAAIGQPVVEVHITSLAGRDEFRHTSLIAPVCKGSVMGFGLDGYRLAIESLI